MAHNVIKADCHYLQIHLAIPQRMPNEKCSLIIRWHHSHKLDILQLSMHLPASSLHSVSLSVYRSPIFFFYPLLLLFGLLVCLQLSVCLFICLFKFLDLFVSRPVGRFLTGVALVEPSQGIKSQRERQALSHYAGPPPLALIESSDPKLMHRGAGAHLLSTTRVLHRQTGEPQWQCWIRSAGSDNPPQTLTHSISLSVFAIVLKTLRLFHSCRDSCVMSAACGFIILP